MLLKDRVAIITGASRGVGAATALRYAIAEATNMIETAKKINKTLAVYHNRRHDGNVRAIKEVIEQGLIGDVFHIELSACGYGRPGDAWRSRKEISGGSLYDCR